jgi:hypothetical protein
MCEDLSSDPNNCSACNHPCATPAHSQAVCQQGQCGFVCQPPYANCSGNPADGCETNLFNDPNNCRTCGHACPPGQQCAGGACFDPGFNSIQSNSCPDNAPVFCDPVGCTDTQTDDQNCGFCGRSCSANVLVGDPTAHCDKGVCCPSGQISCNRVCVDPNFDLNCGACGNICQPIGDHATYCDKGLCCLSGHINCNGTCVDPTSDVNNCGDCNSVCQGGKTCIARTCVCPALAPTECGGTCVATISDNNNCGGCGHVCMGGHTCELGLCVCPPLRVECSGVCCPEGQICTNGACSTCVLGQAFCNGHCIDVTTDSSNCGSCGNACTGGKTCIAESCVCPTLAPTDCGGTCVATISDNNNCGKCGHVCTGNSTCVLGLCF